MGWFIFIPALILLIILLSEGFLFDEISMRVFYHSGFFSNESTGFFSIATFSLVQNLAGIFIIVGGIVVGCSEEKIEDEYISSLRLRSVLWSLMVSYAIVLLLFITVFGSLFFMMMILIMFLPFILYIFRFNYLLLKK